MARPALLAIVLLLAATAGCLEIPAASVATSVLTAKGWEENATAARSDARWGGLARTELRVFEHARAGSDYGGHLSVVTIRSFLEQSEQDLRDRLQETVRTQSEAKGIEIGKDGEKGARENAEGRATQWFTYQGVAKSPETLFTRNADVRIVGEVWNCRASRTVVVAVGLAQVNDARVIGGIPITQDPNLSTWRELVADPEGTIEGAKGSGLLDAVACS